jgi:hypothetical protein
VSQLVPPDHLRPVLLVGSGVVAAGLGDAVVALAERTRTGVLNTYAAKGLFAFDHPAHLGTVGLQRDDLALTMVTGSHAMFSPVLVLGVAPGELAEGLPASAEVVDPANLASLSLAVADAYPDRPPLYEALASVCGPLYSDDTLPLSPVRAAGDLAAWLPDNTVVVAAGGLAGFWIGRTFPTRRPATVWLPTGDDPDFVDRTVAQRVAAGDAVVVVAGPHDRGVSSQVVPPEAPVVVERWLGTGPRFDPTERIERLDAALRRAHGTTIAADGAGGRSHVIETLEVAVRIDHLADLEAVAGPVTAWRGVTPA